MGKEEQFYFNIPDFLDESNGGPLYKFPHSAPIQAGHDVSILHLLGSGPLCLHQDFHIQKESANQRVG